MPTEVPFGPTGEVVYNRTYSRPKKGGGKETWPETVERVVRGNMALAGNQDPEEAARLKYYMNRFAILPAGRHLWSTGVEGRQYLFNCHVAGWGDSVHEHFEFTFLRLMEGGGVGSNYSAKHISKFGAPVREIELHMTSDSGHADYAEMQDMLSAEAPLFRYGGGVVADSREGWAEALSELIRYHFEPEHTDADDYPVLFDVSDVRPSGAPLKTFGGTASGPAPFVRMMKSVNEILNKSCVNGFGALDAMAIDHAIAECVVSGGNRRSARMAMLHWEDPQIFDFINCKQDTGLHWTTNISIEVDDEFTSKMHVKGHKAHEVHMAAVNAVLANGEPGYWNSSLSQTGEINEVICTNPCGEITLEEWENCNLGHVNMDYFHDKPASELLEAHRLVTRFLIRATFGDVNDSKQAEKLARNRRIGVGHLGVQGYWAKQGVKYSQIPHHAPSLLQALYAEVRKEARAYAFELRIPEPVKVTTVAPTGSVAKLPGVSEGIHPIYARWYDRRVRFSLRDAEQANTVLEAIEQGFTMETDQYDASGQTAIVVYPTEDILVGQVRALGIDESVVQSADQLTLAQLLEVQRCYQTYYADNAVSFTANIPEGKYTVEQVAKALTTFLPELKGTTLMVDASRPQSPYTRISKADYENAVARKVEDSTDLECASGACPVR